MIRNLIQCLPEEQEQNKDSWLWWDSVFLMTWEWVSLQAKVKVIRPYEWLFKIQNSKFKNCIHETRTLWLQRWSCVHHRKLNYSQSLERFHFCHILLCILDTYFFWKDIFNLLPILLNFYLQIDYFIKLNKVLLNDIHNVFLYSR